MFSIDVYRDEKAPAYALMTVTLRKYGMEALEYEPELLRAEIEKDYSIKLSDLQHDKIQAAFTVLLTDHFEHDWIVFQGCGHFFNNQPIECEDFQHLEAEEIAVALAEANLILKDKLEDGEKLEYGDEVRAYMGIAFYEYGLHKAPSIFPKAIMPKSVEGPAAVEKEKNEALKEIFDAHVSYILEYLDKLG